MAAGALQTVKKPRGVRARRREKSKICFRPRRVRGRKHFSRSERRIVRLWRTTEVQGASHLSKKFRGSLRGGQQDVSRSMGSRYLRRM